MPYTHYSRSELQELLMNETKKYTSALRIKSHEELKKLGNRIEAIQNALGATEGNADKTEKSRDNSRRDNDQIRP